MDLSETDTYIYSQLAFDKGAKACDTEKLAFPRNGFGTTEHHL